MVSLDNIHVVGSLYMSLFGGYKPVPDAFINYFKRHNFKAKRLFVLGNRLVDMKLATALHERLKCKVMKCLMQRSGEVSIAKGYADAVVHNLREAREEITKFKPDIVLSDFDNTLAYSGYDVYEAEIEKLRFWERYARSRLARLIYGIGSQLSYPFLRRTPYGGTDDNTEAFIRTLKCPLLIHTMSPEIVVWRFLKDFLN